MMVIQEAIAKGKTEIAGVGEGENKEAAMETLPGAEDSQHCPPRPWV